DFLTAVARAAVDLACGVAHDFGDRLQHFVAGWMPECVVVLLEVIDVAHQYGEAAVIFLEPRNLVVETLHQRPVIRQPRKAVGSGEKLELLILLAQRFIDPIELGSPFAQTIDHVVEDFGQVTDLTTTRCRWQIDSEIATGNFAGGFGQAVEWSGDETSKPIRGGG